MEVLVVMETICLLGLFGLLITAYMFNLVSEPNRSDLVCVYQSEL